MMISLITGGAGFIGSQLAYKLWRNGEKVILVDNFSYGRRDNLIFEEYDFNSEIIRMDIRDESGLEKILKENQIDYVYNIAGIAPLPDCQTNPVEAVGVNVNGFVNILEKARKYGVKKIIQASTNAIYENVESFPTTEDDMEFPTLIYPTTKYCAERFAQSFCDTYGMDVVCVRFANVYGPHIDCLRKQPPFVAYMIRELFYDRTPIFHGDGEQRRDYIYVDDLIDLLIMVRIGKGFDVVNCSSNQNYSVNELYSLTCEIMGKNIGAVYAEDRHYWEQYEDLYNGKYQIKDSVLSHEINKYTLCQNLHAKDRYGWEPQVDIKAGLKKVIAYECNLLKEL